MGVSRVTYSSNNSHSVWWLDDADWAALEAAGWVVQWVKDDPRKQRTTGGSDRWLGALATSAYREGLSLDEAMDEWETTTGEDPYETGCGCCSEPHSFYEG